MKKAILLLTTIVLATAYGQRSNSSAALQDVYNYTKAVNNTVITSTGKPSNATTYQQVAASISTDDKQGILFKNEALDFKKAEQAGAEQLVETTNIFADTNAPVISPCNLLLPIVEVQINNTASNEDDYGSTLAYTICSARILNYTDENGNSNFPDGVPVEVRNPLGMSQNLRFSTRGGSDRGTASKFITLPANGSPVTFYIKGRSISTVDKTTIVEVATASATCDEAVLARKALMIATSPVLAGLPRVEIEVGSASTLDDYITWSPKRCRIRWVNAVQPPLITSRKKLFQQVSYVESFNSVNAEDDPITLSVQLKNMSGISRLQFADNSLTPGSTATNSEITLSLQSDGSWTEFYVAGNFGNPSLTDKDAVMEIADANTGALLSREAVMVRVRKNANRLSTAERNRFLEALKKVDLTYNSYIDFVKTHSRDNIGAVLSAVASRQAHTGSAFLPWHRAYVLHLERLLQIADPAVTLPYWNYQLNAPNIFRSNFMGSNSTTGSYMVDLASTNPIVTWSLPGEDVPAGIQRLTPYGNGGHPRNVASETTILGLGSPNFSFSDFKAMETRYHNPAHSQSGSNSWLINQHTSTRDPLFFLLHSNVDRMWAKWQWAHDRYNTTDILSYDLQGSFNAPAPGVPSPSVSPNRTLGQYADDTMWPWDEVTGGTPGSAAERPQIAVLTHLPATLGSALPGGKPTVKGMIDYIGITNNTPDSNLDFCFDDFNPYSK